MNILSIQELLTLSEKELHAELEKARTELTQIQLGVKTKHIKDTHKIHEMKRYIAQILTMFKNLAKGNSQNIISEVTSEVTKDTLAKKS
ncbi:50S ribosomal protein L29 [Candidatus Peregrinibacteria bacterium]|nr:50S ribosomal protein L29 [Candidatus Peregrinibacteria bacterium]